MKTSIKSLVFIACFISNLIYGGPVEQGFRKRDVAADCTVCCVLPVVCCYICCFDVAKNSAGPVVGRHEVLRAEVQRKFQNQRNKMD